MLKWFTQSLQLVVCQLKLHPVANKLCSCSHYMLFRKSEALVTTHLLVIMWWLHQKACWQQDEASAASVI